MRILIIGGGMAVKTNLLRRLASWADQVICADQGAEAARIAEVEPSAIIGDFDSISRNTLAFYDKKKDVTLINIQEQETTDLEKAVKLALSLRATSITITCAGGRRCDHFLHTLGLLIKYEAKALMRIVDDYDVISLKTKPFREKCQMGQRISLIPFSGAVKNVTTIGLKYPLMGEDLVPGQRESISNVASRDYYGVDFDSGMMLVFKSPETLWSDTGV